MRNMLYKLRPAFSADDDVAGPIVLTTMVVVSVFVVGQEVVGSTVNVLEAVVVDDVVGVGTDVVDAVFAIVKADKGSSCFNC